METAARTRSTIVEFQGTPAEIELQEREWIKAHGASLRGAVLIIHGHVDKRNSETSPEMAESLFAPETFPPFCDPRSAE